VIQSISAPVIARFCIENKLKYHYYIRDENNLNEFHNYEIGLRKLLKFIKDIVEFPFKRYYIRNNIKVLKNSNKIISNSKFIANLLKKKYNLKSDIGYPKIDFSKLDKNLIKKSEQKYITFIGGKNAMKGYDIVLKIAKQMPEKKFLIVGGVKKKTIKDNLTQISNQKDIMDVYKKTKLLLVPSRWMEAFGRVVEEANYLGIRTITSNRGGLLEVNKNKNNIISDLEDISSWIDEIEVAV
jgi:glycosyltransferase involved in cell wall biosynthesis